MGKQNNRVPSHLNEAFLEPILKLFKKCLCPSSHELLHFYPEKSPLVFNIFLYISLE